MSRVGNRPRELVELLGHLGRELDAAGVSELTRHRARRDVVKAFHAALSEGVPASSLRVAAAVFGGSLVSILVGPSRLSQAEFSANARRHWRDVEGVSLH